MKKYTQEEYTKAMFKAFALGLSVSVLFYIGIRIVETILINLSMASGWKI